MEIYWCNNCKTPIIFSNKNLIENAITDEYTDLEDEILDFIKDKDDKLRQKLYNNFFKWKDKINIAIENKNVQSVYNELQKKYNTNSNDKRVIYKKLKIYLLIKLYKSGAKNRKLLKELDESFVKRVENNKSSEEKKCPLCGNENLKYMGKKLRPVFMEERIMLSELFEEDLKYKNIWAAPSRYIINGEVAEFSKSDLYDLDNIIEKKRNTIMRKIKSNQEQVDFSQFIKANKNHYKRLDTKANNFVQNAYEIYKDRFQVISFSGGKDSTVTSDLVLRSLQDNKILHVFGDTTLEFPTTYDYIEKMKQKPNSPPFITAQNIDYSNIDGNKDSKFFELSKKFGPPSRVMSWCCTIFKTGPIGDEFRQIAEDQKIFTYYGIRRSESNNRKNYDKISRSPKIANQIVASPIIDWKDIDIWLYILTRKIDFNKAYKYGFTRVGCLYCPNNSKWSEFLLRVFMPQKSDKWEKFLIDFAKKIGKPDPKVYVKNGKWKARQGGSGLSQKDRANTIIEAKPCGIGDNAKSYELKKSITEELYELFKPFGEVDKSSGNTILNEVYVRDKAEENIFVLQGNKGQKNLKVNILKAKNPLLLQQRIECQLRKFQSCISCGACDNICPYNAINTKGGSYEIDETKCKHCMKCVAAFHKGCLLAKTTMDY